MADLGSRLKSTFADQASNQKFLQLLHSNRRIQCLKERQIVPSIPLADFQPSILPSIKKEKMTLKSRSKSQAKFKMIPNPQKLSNRKPSIQLDKDTGLQGIRVRSGSKSKMERNDSFENIKNTTRANHDHHVHKKAIKFVTPQKIASLDGFTITSKKTNLTSNKTLIHQIPADQPIESLLLNVKFGKIQDGVSYRAFMKKQLNPSPAQIINRLDAWLTKFKIKTGLIEAKKLQTVFARKSIPNNMILQQFTNYAQLKKQYEGIIPGLQYYDTAKPNRGKNIAATKILALFKMIFDRKYARKLKSLMKKVIVIQRYWKLSIAFRRTRQKVMARISQKIERSNFLINQLMKNWQLVKTSPKIQIHICSLSIEQFKRLSFAHMRQRQNCQLTRIFRVLQTDVSVIYVVPERMKGEVFRYYERIFGFENRGPIFRERLTFISLEDLSEDIFPYMTTASILLYNYRALGRIKQILKNSPNSTAYIVPSYPSVQFTNLSAQLDVPIFSASQTLSKLYSTKSGHFQLLKTISRNLSGKCPFLLPKSVFGIYSEKQLINSLSVLIYKHKDIAKWYLKIDDQINGRGLAVLHVSSLSFLKELQKQQEMEEIPEKQLVKLIASELQMKLRLRLKIFNKEVYGDYDQFMSHFVTRGGLIQAGVEAPQPEISETRNNGNGSQFHPKQHSISFLIEPNGDFCITGTYSRLELAGKNINSAIKCPSDLTVEQVDNQKLIRSLYRHFWGKLKLFGYFTVDCLFTPSSHQYRAATYIIGLDCFLNQKTSSMFVPQFSSKCEYDKETNKFVIKNMKVQSETNLSQLSSEWKSPHLDSQQSFSLEIESETSKISKQKQQRKQIHFIYYPMMKMKQLPGVQEFFKKCKFNNISFDVQRKIGTLFMLVDSIEDGCIGFICSGYSLKSMLDEVKRLVQFMSKEFREKDKKGHKGKAIKNGGDDLGQLRGVLINWIRRTEKQSKKKREHIDLQLIF